MKYIVVAYYTENTGYADEVKNLVSSLNRFKLPMDIVAVPSLGSWQANTQYKAYFIKQMLIKHFPKDILYLDADARVQQYPGLFDTVDFDVGVIYQAQIELISSTLYFANKAKVMELVDRWIKCCLLDTKTWDQRLLQYVLEEESQDLNLKIQHLPQTYCQIYDFAKDEEPVIEQFQASRRLKKTIDLN